MQLTEERVHELIRECQAEAEKSIQEGNPPFGCVITDMNGVILAKAHNTRNTDYDATAHAEIKALRQLSKQRSDWHLDDCIVFANAESCPMCLYAAIKSHVRTFYFGAPSEADMDPMITVHEIAAKTTTPLSIYSSTLANECTEQILRGRATRQQAKVN